MSGPRLPLNSRCPLAQLVRTMEGHAGHVRAVAVSPDGRTLFTGSADGSVKQWEADRAELVRMMDGHTHHVLCVAISPDSRLVYSGSDDKSIKLWNADSGEVQARPWGR